MPEEFENQEGVEDQGAVEETWQGPSQEEWQEAQEVMSYMRELLSQEQQQGQPEPEQDQRQYNLDPFSENYGQSLASFIQDQIQEATAPYSAFTEESLLEEAEARAMDIISEIEGEKGKLPEGGPELVRALANEFIADTQEQYGVGPQAAQIALEQAYERATEIFSKANQSYYDNKMNELSNLGKAPREPDVSGQAATGLNRTKGDEMSLVRSIFGGSGV